jgi:hypothetical protein
LFTLVLHEDTCETRVNRSPVCWNQ